MRLRRPVLRTGTMLISGFLQTKNASLHRWLMPKPKSKSGSSTWREAAVPVSLPEGWSPLHRSGHRMARGLHSGAIGTESLSFTREAPRVVEATGRYCWEKLIRRLTYHHSTSSPQIGPLTGEI